MMRESIKQSRVNEAWADRISMYRAPSDWNPQAAPFFSTVFLNDETLTSQLYESVAWHHFLFAFLVIVLPSPNALPWQQLLVVIPIATVSLALYLYANRTTLAVRNVACTLPQHPLLTA
jgi:hypothetical protein